MLEENLSFQPTGLLNWILDVVSLRLFLTYPGAKTIKKNTNSTQNKSQTHNARAYKVTSFLGTDCELSTETCSRFVYSLGPWTILPKHHIPVSSRDLSDW